jgi:hypothetical protein
MASNKIIEAHRTAVAFVQAQRAGDREGMRALLAMVAEDEKEFMEFFAALANMVGYALASDPRQGWQGFVDAYAASMDQVEARLDAETDT